MFSLNFRDSRPLYEQIYASAKHSISAGIIQSGEKLPSVRELASQLAINPNTIQRAYKTLEAEGWIVSAAGRGSFVSGMPETVQLRKAELYEKIEEAVVELCDSGVSREEIARYILNGDESNA